MTDNEEKIMSMLDSIDPGDLSYMEWTQVGMILKHEGLPVSVWDDWSRRDSPRYNSGECEKKWATFREGSGGAPVTGGTLFQMAAARGWEPPFGEAIPIEWGATEEIAPGRPPEGRRIDFTGTKAQVINGEIKGGLTGLQPVEQARIYMDAMFLPSEFVGYVYEAKKDRRGKWEPANGGIKTRTAEDILKAIGKCKGDLSSVFGTTGEAGAWIRINAMDGEGCGNRNVVHFKHALVESDTLSLTEQLAVIEKLNLPCSAIVYSGGKSVHAIVRVDAEDLGEYYRRVDRLYAVCEAEGFKIDRQNRNPSRLSRIPGILRGSRMQTLIAVRTGAKDWESWLRYVEEEIEADDLGDFENALDMQPPKLRDELIPGILRHGHKMLIAGPSKAGKSYLLLEMAVCIAGGMEWLGMPCKKGRVLYVNLEIDTESFKQRVLEMIRARNLPQKDCSNIDIWNLRGRALPLDKLVPKLIRRAKSREYAAVIIDPIYKILTGDENSASEMGAFTNNFDRICETLGSAVIYCHHHSKGRQDGKQAIDRASGSGVFARDPDALMDLTEIPKPKRYEANLREAGATNALVAAMLRRGFAPKKIDGSGQPWPDAPRGVVESQCVAAIMEDYAAAKDETRKAYPEAMAAAWEKWTGRQGQWESGEFIIRAADRAAGATLWNLEGSVREFAPPKARPVCFMWPLHFQLDEKAGDALSLVLCDIAAGRRRKEPQQEKPAAPKNAQQEAADRLILAMTEAAERKRELGAERPSEFTRKEMFELLNKDAEKPVSETTFKLWLLPSHPKRNPYLLSCLNARKNPADPKYTLYTLRDSPRSLSETEVLTTEAFLGSAKT